LKSYDEIRKSITKGDIILVVSLILACIVLFAFSFGETESLKAEIYVGGEKTHSISLDEVEESYTLNENYCQLLVEKDGVSFVFSDCADQLCVKRGKLKNQGDTMACVPQRVVVILRSDGKEKIDGVAY
jgi:hypothetical protein